MAGPGPLGGGVGESESAHYQRLETSMACLLGGATEGSRSAYHQSFRKRQWWPPWKVLPEDLGASTIIIKKTSMVGPLAGADGDPRVSIINI
jgi:hypothetical protein